MEPVPVAAWASLLLSISVLSAACGEEKADPGAARGGAGASGGASAGSSSSGSGGASAGNGSSGAGSGGGGVGNAGSGNAGSGGVVQEPPEPDEPLSPYIVVDQFGYRPGAAKIAVIRDPETGFDAGESFTPGAVYAVVDAFSDERVYEGAPQAWGGGAVDPSSGDRAYWFDFTSVTAPSAYYVLDLDAGVRSPVFIVAPSVYRDVLKHAVRTFYYQRAGFEKTAEHAGAGYADGASHVGFGQDLEARLFSAPDDASTERDVSGGWYDAGDYNKYTNWHASYVIQLFRAYRERPEIWSDDYGIPESGNGAPDIVDEASFGLEWLERIQEEDGSVLSIVDLDHASPPSSATGASSYGPPSTSATLSSAAAYAFSAIVLGELGGSFAERAAALRSAAEEAWDWADQNPNVQFQNNDEAYGSSGIGAGQQEVDDHGRVMKKLEAACYLFELTGDEKYKSYFEANYGEAELLNPYAYAWQEEVQEALLHYTTLPGASESVRTAIRNAYATALESGENLGAHRGATDPFLAPLEPYTWGSNAVKARQGLVFHALAKYAFDALAGEGLVAAEHYLHYLHGVNPLGLTYLSNMKSAGADRSVNEFFHSWFSDGSADWDRVGESTYGPPPGFLTGGPNSSYGWDACCPSDCGAGNNELCGAAPPSPPAGQPPQKSYLDFNTGWPVNSWSVTENSNGYQIGYIRLLSKFVD